MIIVPVSTKAPLALLESRPDDAQLAALVELGLKHEEQHRELLLTDAKQVPFTSPIEVAYCETAAAPCAAGTAPHSHMYTPQEIAAMARHSARSIPYDARCCSWR